MTQARIVWSPRGFPLRVMPPSGLLVFAHVEADEIDGDDETDPHLASQEDIQLVMSMNDELVAAGIIDLSEAVRLLRERFDGVM